MQSLLAIVSKGYLEVTDTIPVSVYRFVWLNTPMCNNTQAQTSR